MNTTKINRTKLGRTLTAAVAMAAITSGCAIEGGDTGEDDAASAGAESSALLSGYFWLRSVGSMPDWACVRYDGSGAPLLEKYCDNKAAFAWRPVDKRLEAQTHPTGAPARCLSVTSGAVGGVAFMDTCNKTAIKQRWTRELAAQVSGHTYVRLVNEKQGKCLKRPSYYDHAPQLAECNAGDRGQLWEIMPAIVQTMPPAPVDCFATYCYADVTPPVTGQTAIQVHGACDATKLRAAADAIAAAQGFTSFVQEGFCP